MAVIKRADADRIARSAMILDLGDLHRHGEELKSSAKRSAETMLAQAKAERERLIGTAEADGRKAGFDAGFKEGRDAGFAEGQAKAIEQATELIRELTAAWTAGLERFTAERESMLDVSRDQIVRLAALMAERVTKRVVEIDDRVVAGQVAEALSMVTSPGRLRVVVHPADRELAEMVLPDLLKTIDSNPHAELEIDEAVGPGGCIVRTDAGGEIDATIKTQLSRLIAEVLPAAVDPDRDGGKAGDISA